LGFFGGRGHFAQYFNSMLYVFPFAFSLKIKVFLLGHQETNKYELSSNIRYMMRTNNAALR